MAEGYNIGFTLKSTFDNTGTQQAQKELGAVTQSAAKTNTSMSGAGNSSVQMAGKMRQGAASAAALAAAMGQGQGGAAVAARGLGAVLGGLSAGPIGLTIAGIGALVNLVMYFSNKAKEAKEALEKYQETLANRQLEKTIRQYERLTEALNRNVKAREVLNQAWQSKNDAQDATRLAQMDKATQDQIKANPQSKESILAQAGIDKASFVSDSANSKAQEQAKAAEQKLNDSKKEIELMQKTREDLIKQHGLLASMNVAHETRKKIFEKVQELDSRILDAQVLIPALEMGVASSVENQRRIKEETTNAMQSALDAQKEYNNSVSDLTALAEIEKLEAESAMAENEDNIRRQKEADKNIADKKEEIDNLTDKIKQTEEERAKKAALMLAAVGMNPNEWNAAGGANGIATGRTPDEQKALDRDKRKLAKADAKAEKRMLNDARLINMGLSLSGKEGKWYQDYWQQQGLRDQAKRDELNKNKDKEMLTKMSDQLIELQKIATTLKDSITVN